MSRLKFEAICPTPIERQRVGTCLRVFCDETTSTLKVHPEIQDASGTIFFLIFVLEFWKIVNVHSKFTTVNFGYKRFRYKGFSLIRDYAKGPK